MPGHAWRRRQHDATFISSSATREGEDPLVRQQRRIVINAGGLVPNARMARSPRKSPGRDVDRKLTLTAKCAGERSVTRSSAPLWPTRRRDLRLVQVRALLPGMRVAGDDEILHNIIGSASSSAQGPSPPVVTTAVAERSAFRRRRRRRGSGGRRRGEISGRWGCSVVVMESRWPRSRSVAHQRPRTSTAPARKDRSCSRRWRCGGACGNEAAPVKTPSPSAGGGVAPDDSTLVPVRRTLSGGRWGRARRR